jgi:hypothetical protein
MIRTRICFFVLLVAPLLVYWQTTFSDYGFRDDYANAREAREEPGKLVRFTASHGRPLYGALLETSLFNIDEIENLWMLRFAAVVLTTVLGLALWRQLYHSGWTEVEAAAIGLGITLLPCSQIFTSWAIIWPHCVASLLALAGFSAIETELERGGLKRAIALCGGVMIYALATLLYQSNALFAVVPIAAVLLVRITRGSSSDLRWCITHFSALFAGLISAYLLVGALFAKGVFQPSARMQLENNLFTKLTWFFTYPVPNALGLYALRDTFDVGAGVFWISVAVVASVIIWGCRNEIIRSGTTAKRRILFCALGLPFLAHSISLAASERALGYRTLLALSGLVLVLLVFAIRSLLASGKIKPVHHHGALVLLAVIAAVTAHFNSYNLIAVPQGYEWHTVRGAVMRADFPKTSKIFIITPTIEDRATTRVYADEFGSVTTDSDWESREMFLDALHEKYPVKLPKGTNCKIVLGREPPDPNQYDLVIDMRNYKDQAKAQLQKR